MCEAGPGEAPRLGALQSARPLCPLQELPRAPVLRAKAGQAQELSRLQLWCQSGSQGADPRFPRARAAAFWRAHGCPRYSRAEPAHISLPWADVGVRPPEGGSTGRERKKPADFQEVKQHQTGRVAGGRRAGFRVGSGRAPRGAFSFPDNEVLAGSLASVLSAPCQVRH